MEKVTIYVPLSHEKGICKFDELIQTKENSLELCLNSEYNLLDYKTPSYHNDVRLYSVEKEAFINSMEVTYDENSILKKITYLEEAKKKLVYINLTDAKVIEEEISNYVVLNTKEIVEQLLGNEGKVYRLFFDYFYDGEAVDYSAMLGMESDIQPILDRYDGDRDALDNSGDYPQDNCVRADTDYLSVLLMCMDPDESSKVFDDICREMTSIIKNNLIEKLDKARGFAVFEEEYD